MDRMVRKQVYISARQEAMLKRRSSELGITEAQLVREALDAYASRGLSTRGVQDATVWHEEKAFMEDLLNRGRVAGRRRWRRDDLHER